MPRENQRTGLYRSFMVCDDPRGVAESGVIRRQKSRTDGRGRRIEPTEKEREHRGGGRPPAEEKTEMPSRKMKEEINASNSSLQLLRVTRGIQKLNKAIESWSKGMSFEDHHHRPQDIAKDLLRGALDLEESLAMLGRIQEASSEHIKMKSRNVGEVKGKEGEVRFQRSMSERVGDQRNRDVGFERRRISCDGSSRDCYEELRKSIKESFIRQNLIFPENTGEKIRVCRSNVASSSSGNASTSSSTQSSTFHGNYSGGSAKSSLSWDVPQRNSFKGPNLIARLMGLDETPVDLEKNRTVYIKKTETKKLSFQGEEQKKKETVILEIMQSKETVLQSPASTPQTNCQREEILDDNSSSIVLIRPLRVPQLQDTEGKSRSKMHVVPKKPRMQGEIHPRMISQRKEVTAFGRPNGKTDVEFSLKKRDKVFKEMMISKAEDNLGKKKTKPVVLNSTKGLNNATKSTRSIITNKKVVKEDGRGKDKQKPTLDAGLRPIGDHVKLQRSVNSSDIAKNKSSTERLTKLHSKVTGEQKGVRVKKVGEPVRQKAKKRSSQENSEGSDLPLENTPVSSLDTIGSVNQPSTEDEASSADIGIQGLCGNQEIFSYEVSTEHSDDKQDSETSTDTKHFDTEISLKSFLSTSPAFHNYAEKFFDLNTCVNINITTISPSTSQNKNNSMMISNQRLSLDCAKELTRLKSLHLSKATHPARRINISLDELLVGILDGFDTLTTHGNTFSGQKRLNDHIEIMLEKDLKGRKAEMASEMWDMGWRSGFRIDDIHRVVIGVERLILLGLIEEILS